MKMFEKSTEFINEELGCRTCQRI